MLPINYEFIYIFLMTLTDHRIQMKFVTVVILKL